MTTGDWYPVLCVQHPKSPSITLYPPPLPYLPHLPPPSEHSLGVARSWVVTGPGCAWGCSCLKPRPWGRSDSQGVGHPHPEPWQAVCQVLSEGTAGPDHSALLPAGTRPATASTSRPCHATVTTGKQSPAQGPPSTTSSTFASLWLRSRARVRGLSVGWQLVVSLRGNELVRAFLKVHSSL